MNAREALRRAGETKPLVHHITNYVTVNLVANVTLATGALPVMAQAKEEVREMTSLASALVLNIGTLDPQTVEAMVLAGKTANECGVPVVLDPVGAGATALRTRTVERLVSEVRVAAVCGNAGEISTVAGLEAEVRGVESLAGDAEQAVRLVAKALGATVAATGPVDYVSDGETTLAVCNGHPLMGRIVGSGCASTAVVGCLAASAGTADVETVAHALAFYGAAGEDAAGLSDGPGTFEPRLLDAISALSEKPERLEGRLKVEGL
ncbi:thiM: hydroxyethylthiazole kinase [Rubrobacter radiotolerans]|uniref:Hydroxyethylthiazole kinase n=1 Tax=Rubrobacter radiotolerans TaxID=42256 RepID=A0A023X6S7_RUBRA|nr:hydroxyethylthiazole kinase [Rubrobacter radiotolerans]AHY47715.1 thiM: hydroxyethylthiazole kinase [Rubrobacter radiotolerans]MDX5895118.1 hydroxyethylthiazole kinase [Rubrobacter radiotolerans]SMC07489.1 hydroxyethylthiazole kinase [Rubrobacter radiotolerans DSM 5868]